MKLLSSPTSPYARKVRICLHEKGIPCEEVNGWGPDVSVSQHNPLGKVPTLVLDDGTDLFDSVVIVEYLDGRWPAPRLIPEDPEARARVRRWEALADGIADATVLATVEGRRAEERRDPAVIDRQKGKIMAALAQVEADLGDAFAIGNEFSLADAALIAAIGYVDLRQPGLREGKTPRLDAYLKRHADRPSIAATVMAAP